MRTKKRDLFWHIILGITGVLLVSCAGSPSTSSHNSTPQPAGSPSMPSHNPTSQPGSVTLRIQFPSSHSNTITITITNGEAQTITTTNHHTNCSILLAEQQIGGQWRPLPDCASMMATRPYSIPPGHTQTGPLDTTTWPAGTYRITLEYVLGQQLSSLPMRTAYSATFVLPLT